jgi:predicted permease
LLTGSIALRLINALRPENLPDLVFRLDWRMLAFTIGVSALSAILFGVRPALTAARVDVTRHLREDSRTVGSPGKQRGLLAHTLIAGEIALAVLLVSGAALMLRSIAKLRQVESGVNMDRVLTFELRPPAGLYPNDSARTELTFRLLDAVRSAPGVVHAGAGRSLPFLGLGWSGDFILEGWPAGEFGVEVRHREATAGYFQALEIPLRDGALLPDRLLPGTTPPVLVNEAFASRYAAGQSLVGRRIAFSRTADSNTVWYPIAGVVGNERMQLTMDVQPEIIGHIASDTPGLLRFVVKSRPSTGSIVAPLRSAIASIDPELPMLRVRSMESVAIDALSADRYLMVLLGVFAGIAMVLAVVGVYGVSAQVARWRTREVGIRLALGATPVQVTKALVARTVWFVTVGAGAGLVAVLLAGRVIEKLLFQVKASDPLTLGAVVAVQLLVAVVATLQPAVRAARTDASAVMNAM